MLTIFFFGIQIISLCVMLLFIHEYKRIAYKHQQLVESIENITTPKCMIHSTIIIWIYAATTMTLLISTTVFFYMKIASFT